MATKPHNPRALTWATAYEKYLNLNQRLIEALATEHDALERAIAAQEEELLDTPAPNLQAVLFKIGQLMWSEQLHGLDPESEAKRLVLEDLADLIAENRQILGDAA